MALFNFFTLLFTLLINVELGLWRFTNGGIDTSLPMCNNLECPTYDVIHVGEGYEIRRYNSTMWAATAPIQDISLVGATNTGFSQLFNYIQGGNDYKERMEMTAPVLSEVNPSESTFVTSFYVPKKNQASPPPAKGIDLRTEGVTYVAVHRFSGFVMDATIDGEVAALTSSVAGSVWSDAIKKSHAGGDMNVYTVAQYNSPFEFENRVNEIWLKFDM